MSVAARLALAAALYVHGSLSPAAETETAAPPAQTAAPDSRPDASAAPPGPVAWGNATTITAINLRAGKGTQHAVITILGKWERVSIVGLDGEYARVSDKRGTTGYLKTKYLNIDPAPLAAEAAVTAVAAGDTPAPQEVPAPEPPPAEAPRTAWWQGWHYAAFSGLAYSTADAAGLGEALLSNGVTAEVLNLEYLKPTLGLSAERAVWGPLGLHLGLSYVDSYDGTITVSSGSVARAATILETRFPSGGLYAELAAQYSVALRSFAVRGYLGTALALDRDLELSINNRTYIAKGPLLVPMAGGDVTYPITPSLQGGVSVRFTRTNDDLLASSLFVRWFPEYQ